MFSEVVFVVLEKATGGSRDLKLSILEGSFASVMFGGAAVFIIPFALFLGASSMEIGFLTAFPTLIGAWIQLLSIKLLDKYKSRKKLVFAFVALQAFSWLPLIAVPFIFSQQQVLLVTIFYTAGTVFGAVGGPLWQSWMRSITPQGILGTYFGVRNAITGTVSFLSTLALGLFLGFFSGTNPLIAFSVIFFASAAGRMLSAFMFTKIKDPEHEIEKKESLSAKDFFNILLKTNFGYFILYIGLMTFTISLIGPFFSVYLINTLGLSNNYGLYTVIIASAAIAALLSLPYWGRRIDRHGDIKVLKATSFLLILHPLTLIFVRDPIGLIFTEFLNGIIFAGFYLALANFVYSASPEKKTLRFASYQTVFVGTAAFFGLIISGFLQSIPMSFSILTNSFYVICAVSLILRYLIYKGLITRIKEVKPVTPIWSKRLVFGVLTLEPIRHEVFSNTVFLVSYGTKYLEKAIKRIGNLEEKEMKKVVAFEEKEFEEVKEKVEEAAEEVIVAPLKKLASRKKLKKK